MISAEELRQNYDRPPAVGLTLGKRTNAIYALLQQGLLDGHCIDGKWYVSKESVARYQQAGLPSQP